MSENADTAWSFARERFEVRAKLGSGGQGEVFTAFDRSRNSVVALKQLRRASADAVLRFKQEFRALADLVHPNLCALYELISDGDHWCFTMERVQGVDLCSYIRGEVAPRERPSAPTETMTADQDEAAHWAVEPPAKVAEDSPDRPPTAAVVELLLPTLLQLVDGLSALHQAGFVHLDIKPSNVLVTPDGVVKILDFGLASALTPVGAHGASVSRAAGTVGYMSPEQSQGLPLTTACDWYAVGVVLYEAVCGQRPFRGGFMEVLRQQLGGVVAPPSSVVRGLPTWIDALCLGLLSLDPAQRLDGDAIRSWLESPRFSASVPLLREHQALTLLGREYELSQMQRLLRSVSGDRSAIGLVRGQSGMGKSSLLHAFFASVDPEFALLLTGRCYERESVPFKAVDALVDHLALFLRGLDDGARAQLIPEGPDPFFRLFPVLKGLLSTRAAADLPSDSEEVRRRAFTSLRSFLAKLASDRKVIIAIDDLQWTDQDSTALLGELLRPPALTNVLWLFVYRDGAERTPLLAQFLDEEAIELPNRRREEIVLGGLHTEECIRLLEERLGPGVDERVVHALAAQSEGNPFFVTELARWYRSAPTGEISETTLAGALSRRIQSMPHNAQRLLQVVALAGQPIDRTIAFEAAALGPEAQDAPLTLLTARLIASVSRASPCLVTYHDRVRETVIRALPDDTRRGLHQRLADVLIAGDDVDPELIVTHLRGADDHQRMPVFARLAGDRALAGLAFDRAARHYQEAFETTSVESESRRPLQRLLADALSKAGHSAEAAPLYEALAEDASVDERARLLTHASNQFLKAGLLDESLRLIPRLGRWLGVRPSRLSIWAVTRWVFGRVVFPTSRVTVRDDADPSPHERMQLSICWELASTLGTLLPPVGMAFQSRLVRLAAHTGDRRAAVLALALEAIYLCYTTHEDNDASGHAIARAEGLAAPLADPYVNAWLDLARGTRAALKGDFQTGQGPLKRANETFRQCCPGTYWEQVQAQGFHFICLMYRGRWARLHRELSPFREDARRRGDILTTMMSNMTGSWPLLAAGETDQVRQMLQQVESGGKVICERDYLSLVLAKQAYNLYTGDADAAVELIRRYWPRARRSGMLSVRWFSFTIRANYTLAHLLAAHQGRGPEPHLALAHRMIRKLRRIDFSPFGSITDALAGSHALLLGHPERAAEHFGEAARKGVESDLMAHAMAAQRARGLLLGSDGKVLVTEAESWLAGQGVRDFQRLANWLTPGVTG